MDNTEIEPLELLHATYGGTLRRNIDRGNLKHNIFSQWYLCGAKLTPFLDDMRGRLIIKKPQASIMRRFVATIGKGSVGLSEDVRVIRDLCYKEMRKLNGRGR